MTTLLLFGAWLALAYLNAGFMLADYQSIYSCVTDAREEYRYNLGFAIGFSLIPILSWVITLFLTGFYCKGWMRPRLHPPTA
jgi:hypothetical protein